MQSPRLEPKELTKATAKAGYNAPPANTVKNAGPDTNNVALEIKLIRKIPKSPSASVPLKKSL